mmetsp:Transcript_2618/g.10626  ORF Transcript_2618/g.10626 Transcript_2618/m.10626 type:complete len:1139 (-) Transcript_2618:122-3538(-)
MATQLGALKRIRGFQGFNVDGFNYQGPDIVAYFLTHFHSDHTCGLHAGFKGPAPIYCSPVTGALLTAVMGVKSSMVRPMPLGVPFDVPTGDGEVAEATFIDANHCPGSVLVHLRHKATGRIVLHTGDFRAARRVREDPALHRLIRTHGKIDELLLDTTYCAPQWKFPDQDDVCAAMGEITRRELAREPRTLFLVGSYQIGKERAVAAVARAANSRAGVGWHRARTLKLSGWWDDSLFVCEDDEYAMQSATDAAQSNSRIIASLASKGDGSGATGAIGARDPGDPTGPRSHHRLSPREPPTLVRVVPMGGGSAHDNMRRLLRDDVDPDTGLPWYAAVVAFRPTGWSYTRSRTAMAVDGRAGAPDAGNPLGKVKGEVLRVKEEAAEAAEGWKAEPEEAEARVAVEVPDGGASSARADIAAELASAYKPWIENDGRTRCYSVPYSEHSSFVELVEFVKRIRPRRVTPTVNADTKADKDRIMKHFLEFTDLAADKNRLDHYFFNKRSVPEVKAEVKREIESDPVAALPSADGGDGEGGGIDPEILAALGDALTPEELRQQSALWDAARRTSRAAREAARAAALGPFPLGCVALVRGGGGGFGGGGPRYVQFKDKSHVEQRLRGLGATIVHRMSPKVTHVVVPAGGEAFAEEERRHGLSGDKSGDARERASANGAKPGGSAPKGKEGYEPPDAARDGEGTGKSEAGAKPGASTPPVVVAEGWVMRHWRAFGTGAAATHDAAAVRAHEERVREERRREASERTAAAKRRREEAESGVEQRPGRERTMSRAVMDRVGRALAQRLFLVQRRDISRGPAGVGGAASTETGDTSTGPDAKWHAVFAVFGTTGNVYECHVCANPSCTCPDFAGDLRSGGGGASTGARGGRRGGHICKHLLWVYLRVLGVQRDDPVLCQVALLRSELAKMLATPTRAQRAELAAAAVREAYLAATGAARGTEELAPPPVTRQPLRSADGDGGEPVTCPVCFDPLEDPADVASLAGVDVGTCASGTTCEPTGSGAKVWWCRGGCGGNVHSACMRRWIDRSGMAPACPLCRATWVPQDDAAARKDGGEDATGNGLPTPALHAGTTGNPDPDPSAPFTSPGGSSYVNLRAYQGGTAARRDLSQYNDFARKAIEKREREQREGK